MAPRAGPQAPLLTALRADMGVLSAATVEEAADQEAAAESLFTSTRMWAIIVLAVSAAIGLSLAFGIARLIVRPLARCVRTLVKIGEDDLTARVSVTGRDEIAQLGHTLNATVVSMPPRSRVPRRPPRPPRRSPPRWPRSSWRATARSTRSGRSPR